MAHQQQFVPYVATLTFTPSTTNGDKTFRIQHAIDETVDWYLQHNMIKLITNPKKKHPSSLISQTFTTMYIEIVDLKFSL